jgi:CHAD domain-containing protein
MSIPVAATYELADAVTPRLDRVPGVARVRTSRAECGDAIYYDTLDLRLTRGGVTLRRQAGAGGGRWRLSLPAGPLDEVRMPAGTATATDRVPAELAALVRAWTRDAPLAPVAQIRTVRSPRRLLDEAGDALADVAAVEISASLLDGSGGTAWREFQVAVPRPCPGLLEAIAGQFARAGAWPAATQSTLARALNGALPPAAASGRAGLRPQSCAAGVIGAYLAAQRTAILRLDPQVRRDQPDAIHQMRVACRRTRSALQAFGEVVDGGHTRPLRAELSWFAAVLGQARDAEVLLARLERAVATVPPGLGARPAADRIRARLRDEHRRGLAATLRAMDGPRYLDLLRQLDDAVAHPPLTPLAGGPAASVLRRPVRRAGRRMERALARAAGAQDAGEAIHEARKAAKRARYAAEAATPALGDLARSQAARAKAVQAALGDHHDSTVARELLCELAAAARARCDDTFAYGALYGHEACQASGIERSLRQQVPPFRPEDSPARAPHLPGGMTRTGERAGLGSP